MAAAVISMDIDKKMFFFHGILTFWAIKQVQDDEFQFSITFELLFHLPIYLQVNVSFMELNIL